MKKKPPNAFVHASVNLRSVLDVIVVGSLQRGKNG
jgi:hypothetical protein